MSRVITVAAAQLGPVERGEPRAGVVERLCGMMRQAHAKGASFVVFPELALTTFFPRWHMPDEAELERYFELEMPSAETRPLFELAVTLGIGFNLGYAEQFTDADGRRRRFNTSILVDERGSIVGKYRKVHLPGHYDYEPERPWQHLEKGYFEVGDLGFPVWRTMGGVMGMAICNDRRWPETWRVMGLQGVELVSLGYNTPVMNAVAAGEAPHLRMFHNHMSMQAGAYQNGCFVVGVAKAGREEGADLLGQSAIIAPTGEIVAQATGVGDELIVSDCDLDRCQDIRNHVFSFARHRRPECYGPITAPH